MKSLVTFLFFTCAAIGTFNSTLCAEQATAQATHYTNDAKKYSVDYPGAWQKKEISNLDLFLFAPLKNSLQEAPASINIISEKVGQDVSLNKFYTESVANLVRELKDVKIEKSGEQTTDRVTAKWIQYSHQIMSINFRVMQYFYVENGNLYVVTFSAPSAVFDSYRPDFDVVMNSLKFKTS
jgi:hypothetical protein